MFAQEIWNFTGVHHYPYDRLCDVDSSHVHPYCQSTRKRAAAIAKAWSAQIATEWAMRNYLAVKMILASQLLLNVAAYSERKNILLTHPYLLYYALLNSCRAFLFSDLTVEWDNGRLRTASHEWIRKTTVNSLNRLCPAIAFAVEELVLKAKKQRELFSYGFPARGPRVVPGGFLKIDATCQIAGLICELAEANSECLETAWKMHSQEQFEVDWNQLCDLGFYDAGVRIDDDDDHYRLSYLSRYSGPACLVGIATQGMTDDFHGAWCPEDETDTDNFDPDHCEAPSIFEFH